jgi:hypothetical protein
MQSFWMIRVSSSGNLSSENLSAAIAGKFFILGSALSAAIVCNDCRDLPPAIVFSLVLGSACRKQLLEARRRMEKEN